VWAFDISHVSAQVTARRVAANHTKNAVQIVRASAFALPYRDRSFSHVIGIAIIHHVHFNLEEVAGEIFRVLKPGGTAVFLEAFGQSQFLQVARRWFPVKSLIDPGSGERPLRYSDFNIFSKTFDEVRVKEFQIFSRLDRIFKSRRIIRFLNVIDEWLLAKAPWLGHLSRLVVVELRRGPC
jgi:ubiquinone/menaquinone biosynthesis C-methylase UbiE